jgi:hypothetical protein
VRVVIFKRAKWLCLTDTLTGCFEQANEVRAPALQASFYLKIKTNNPARMACFETNVFDAFQQIFEFF